MIESREAGLEDFEGVYRELLVHLDPGKDPGVWRRIFDPPWRQGGLPVGQLLLDGGRPVGFLGTVFAPLRPGDSRSPVCNLTSWIVLEPYRGHALRLLAPILSRSDWTITNLSPTEEVGQIFKALGFETLETHRCLLPAAPTMLLPSARRGVVRGLGGADSRTLPEATRWLVGAHGGLARFLLVEEGADASVLAFSLGRARGLRVARIHHAADPPRVLRCLPSVQWHFLRFHGAAVMEFDRRILGGALPPLTRSRALPTPRLYRSPDRPPSELTEIFSERILLEL